tara:strand:+ start:284 stop:1276 length:993 start_codon:yes stop_codon:yes gene_type:complete
MKNKRLKLLEDLPLILAILTFIIVICRRWITFAGYWILTISSPKLFLLTLGFVFIISFLVVIGAKKWKILLVLILSLIGIRSASQDFYGLRNDGNFGRDRNSYHYRNNPYMGSAEKLRELINISSKPSDFWRQVCAEFSDICLEGNSTEKRAERAMLIVSNLFYFGNSPLGEDAQRGGCVGKSSETGNILVEKDWALYQSSRIGCCNDFAYFLASFLNHLKIKNEFVYFPGHIANRFVDDQGEWTYLDSNSNIMVKGLFPIENSDLLHFNIYPHPNVDSNLGVNARYSIYNFQRGLVSKMSAKVHYIFNFLSTEDSKEVDTILRGEEGHN